MQTTDVWRQFESLPASAQRQVADFVTFLGSRYADTRPTRSTPLDEEPFVGMWVDREDLRDSSAWVRRVREQEWR